MKINVLKNKTTPFVCLMALWSLAGNVYATDKTIFVVDIMRHGDRTPARELPKDPYSWPEGLGNETAKGLQQEYALGQKWHKHYIGLLLPQQYSINTMYVRSSDLDRTLMSAQAALLGLYPLHANATAGNNSPLPYNYQPIPIHTVPKKQDSLIVPNHNEAEFNQLVQQYPAKTAAWQQKIQSNQAAMHHWQEVTGLPVTTLQEVLTLGDVIYIRNLHHVRMPKGLTSNDVNTIISLYQWTQLAIYQSPEVASYCSTDLAIALRDYFQAAIQHTSPLKYVLLSGHETTIMSLLSLLHYPLTTIPYYGSDLNFSLYQHDDTYYIHVQFNNQAIHLPFCQQQDCSLQEFEQSIPVSAPTV